MVNGHTSDRINEYTWRCQKWAIFTMGKFYGESICLCRIWLQFYFWVHKTLTYMLWVSVRNARQYCWWFWSAYSMKDVTDTLKYLKYVLNKIELFLMIVNYRSIKLKCIFYANAINDQRSSVGKFWKLYGIIDMTLSCRQYK